MIQFWQEDENRNSSKRLGFLGLIVAGIVNTTIYLYVSDGMDYGGAIAILSGFITGAVTIMTLGKKQENDRAKIDKK